MWSDNLPKVTVVVPVRNEERYIAQCLTAICAQDYPADRLEILLVDGESDDKTLDIVQSFPEHDRIRILHNSRRQQATGMNVGIAAAQGDIAVRVDGHAIIESDYVRQRVI